MPTRLLSASTLPALASTIAIDAFPPTALSVHFISATLRPATHTGHVAHLWFSLRPGAPPADGRVRLSLSLPAGILPLSRSRPLPLTTHLYVAAPAVTLVKALGAHGAAKAWLPSGSIDPWHRDAAFFGWDARGGGVRVTQERRVYMGGLSDEAGAAAGVAVAIKQVGCRILGMGLGIVGLAMPVEQGDSMV